MSGAKLAPVIATRRPPSGSRGERRRDMPQGRVRHAAIDMRDRRERRVHQHDARHDAGVEMIVDMRGVEPRDGDAGEESVENAGAGVGEFVEDERRAGELGEDREQAGAGGRLQHDVGRRDRGRDAGRIAQRDRRRELLKRLALFGAARVGRKKRRRPSRASAAWRPAMPALRPQRRAELAQEQDRRRLAGVVSRLPGPGAVGVGCAEGGFHRGAQHRRVDALAAFEMGKEKPRGRGDGGSRIGSNDGAARRRPRTSRDGT